MADTCTKCGIQYEKDSKKGRWCSPCKSEYRRRWYRLNAEKERARVQKYRKDNPQKIQEYRNKNKDRASAYQKQWYQDNKEKRLQQTSKWKKANRELVRSYTAKYKAAQLKATPSWADVEAIKEFYRNCPPGYEVDHIHPLQGKTICGLHVLENLQYLTVSENRKKYCSFKS